MNTKYKCERCGERVNGTEYKDGYLIIEQHYECSKCGFRRHWAYGNLVPDDSEYAENVTENV